MAGPSASARFQVGEIADDQPFELIEDDDDGAARRPAYYQPAVVLSSLVSLGPGSRLLQLATLGRAHLRLYHPDTAKPEVVALDPITQIERGAWSVGGSLVALRASGYTGDQVVFRGRREKIHREAIAWNLARRASPRYAAYGSQFEIVYASEFVDADGSPIPVPVHTGSGEFTATKPAIGGLVVQYVSRYTEVHVFYDLPDHRVSFGVVAAGAGQVVRYFPPPDPPPITVVARSGASVSILRARREVGRFEFPDAAFNDDGNVFDGTEIEAATKDYRIENPTDPAQFVDVRDYQSITLQDDRGRLLRLRIKDRS